jgi:hypothetical protein
LYNAASYHPAHITTRPSAIIAASSVFGPTLGKLHEKIAQWMALPERVTTVQADNRVMFHWAKGGQHSTDNVRADTATYEWTAAQAALVLANPYALNRGDRERTFQIIGRVEPPDRYSDVQFLRLIVKYVPSSSSRSGKPELWLSTYTPHSADSIKPYLSGAVFVTA